MSQVSAAPVIKFLVDAFLHLADFRKVEGYYCSAVINTINDYITVFFLFFCSLFCILINMSGICDNLERIPKLNLLVDIYFSVAFS